MTLSPDFSIVWAGHDDDQSYIKHLRSLLKKHRLVERFILLENPSDSCLHLLYKSCEVVVIPSLYEGFGLPVLESMALGVPVLCSEAASLAEVGREYAYYFDPHLPKDFLAALAKLRSNRDKLNPLALQKFACSHSWHVTARNVYDFILPEA